MARLLLVLLVAMGCSKKDPDPATPPAEPVKKPAAEPQVVVAAKAVLADGKKELAWTSPSGEKIALAVKQTWKSNKAVVELGATTAGKATTLVAYGSDVEKGDIHYEAVGAIGTAADGSIMFVAGMTKVTGKPANYYDAYVFVWNPDAKQLVQASKHYWEDVYDPIQ